MNNRAGWGGGGHKVEDREEYLIWEALNRPHPPPFTVNTSLTSCIELLSGEPFHSHKFSACDREAWLEIQVPLLDGLGLKLRQSEGGANHC
jgi:hypothetical protein